MSKPLLILLAVLLFLPNLFNLTIFSESGYNHAEEYDPSLSYINSVDKLNQHIDSVLKKKGMATGTYESVFEMSGLISKRFYHGYSHFTLKENWIAAIAGKLIDSGMACKVHPDKILLHSNAACSQQAIVLMALLRKKGFTYRHLSFPHHYAVDVLIGSKWYFFDPNKEPFMNKKQRSEDGWQYNADSLKQYYDSSRMPDMDNALGNGVVVQKGSINEIPAPRARLFQTVTGLFSKILWCFPLLFLFVRFRKIHRLTK